MERDKIRQFVDTLDFKDPNEGKLYDLVDYLENCLDVYMLLVDCE